MTDTTHNIDAMVEKANAITRHPSMGGAMGHAQDVLGDMSAALTALQKERDVAISKVDFYEQKDGMDGAVVHAIREMLYAHNVPKAAFIDDHVANVIVQRETWKARAEAAEAALLYEVKRSRTLDIAAKLTPPADLAKGAADE